MRTALVFVLAIFMMVTLSMSIPAPVAIGGRWIEIDPALPGLETYADDPWLWVPDGCSIGAGMDDDGNYYIIGMCD